MKAYERAIARSSDPQRKKRLSERHSRLLARLEGRTTRIVVDGESDELDSPDDLEEKADLLADSQEKVARQLRRIEQHLANLARRAKLGRHGRAADDTMFVENIPRRVGSTRSVVTQASSAGNGQAAPRGAVAGRSPGQNENVASAPSAEGGGGSEMRDADDGALDSAGGGQQPSFGNSDNGAGFGDGAAAPPSTITPPPTQAPVTVRNLIDPGTFRGLQQRGAGSLTSHIALLKREQKRLKALSLELSRKSAALRHKAKQLKDQP